MHTGKEQREREREREREIQTLPYSKVSVPIARTFNSCFPHSSLLSPNSCVSALKPRKEKVRKSQCPYTSSLKLRQQTAIYLY
jgi:hypothetical protein